MDPGPGSTELLQVLVPTPHRFVKSGVTDVCYRLAATGSGKCFVSDVRILWSEHLGERPTGRAFRRKTRSPNSHLPPGWVLLAENFSQAHLVWFSDFCPHPRASDKFWDIKRGIIFTRSSRGRSTLKQDKKYSKPVTFYQLAPVTGDLPTAVLCPGRVTKYVSSSLLPGTSRQFDYNLACS